MGDIHIGGMTIEDSGDGPPVVMIHGLGGTSNSFQPLMGVLNGYRTLRLDLPGAGRSSLRPGRPGLAGLVSAVYDGLKTTSIGRAHFIAHSMGTLICQQLAAQSPDVVQSLVLFGPILEPSPSARRTLKERATTARMEGMAGIADAISVNSIVASPNSVAAALVRESLLRQNPAGYAAHCEALSDADAAKHDAIQCPTLLVAGEKDTVAPVREVRRLQRKIAGARLEIIPNIAHWMMVEAGEQSSKLLQTHLTQTKQ